MNQQEQDFIARLQKFKQTKPNPGFVIELRRELQQAVSQKPQTSYNPFKQLLTIFTFMNRFVLPIALVAVVALGTAYWYTNNGGDNQALITLNSDNKLLPGKYSITEVEQNSFGDLDKVSIIAGENQTTRNQSGGGNGNAAVVNAAAPAMSEDPKMAAPGMGVGDTSILPVDQYKFVYEGDKIDNLSETRGVLKRIKPQQDSGLVNRIVQMFSFGLVDMSKFSNQRIQNFSFVEDKEFGMGMNVDLSYGSVNIYQNYEKWPQVEYKCEANYCGSFPRLKESDIPSDEEAIAIANRFVGDYNISLEGYGQPMTYDYGSNWRIMYARATDKTSYPFPDNLTVIYPLVLEGQNVLDESGNPTGLYINIDVRNRKVSNMYGLETKQFQKSNYIGETNAQRILDIAERGGYRSSMYDNGGRTVSLKLDTPTVELVKVWYTTDYTKPGEDLYVPALVFPIKDWEKNNYWRKNLVVPLVKDLLDNENPGGQPIPLDSQPAANVKGITDVAPAVKEDAVPGVM